MRTLRVGGVPEHFNYPWHYGIAQGIFAKHHINVEWLDVKQGSGAMCSMLDEDLLDVALVLTEGIVKHLHNGSTSRIIQQYVKSPLIWGVHSRSQSSFTDNDLSNARIARSRIGSGSHIMAFVHAQQKNYAITEDNFVTVDSIDGAVASFNVNESDILLWEQFMTQPYVSAKQMNRIGTCISPWPCFMMVGSGNFLKEQSLIENLSAAIIESIEQFVNSTNPIEAIAEMYGLETDQVAQWYATVEWQTSPWVSKKMLQNVVNTLGRLDILTKPMLNPSELCFIEAKLY